MQRLEVSGAVRHTHTHTHTYIYVVRQQRVKDNRHMKVVRLSALRTGRLYFPGYIPGPHFC
jgi:hypothetical protein